MSKASNLDFQIITSSNRENCSITKSWN